MESPPTIAAAKRASILVGVLSGAAAALFWAVGFVAARHAIDIGMTPEELALHRFVWAGLLLLPLVLRGGAGGLAGIGWGRALALTFFGGPPLAIISYAGFLIVPLGHGGLIQPSCAALGGLLLATLVIKEKLPARRLAGALVIVGGLVVIGGEALTTIGTHGLLGDLSFVLAGFFFATFGMLLRLSRVTPMRAAAVVGALSLVMLPIHWLCFGFEHILALGWRENLLQAVTQGGLAGAGAIYFFTRAVMLLGAGRAALYPSLVPPFTLLIGFLALGVVPSAFQLVGLGLVLVGFRLTQRG